MSGTSLDGLDAALVEVDGRGLLLRTRFVRGRSCSLGPLQAALAAFAQGGEALRAEQIASLAAEFSALHVALLNDLLSGERADLVAVHGQTVHHAPPLSWQFFSPAPVAQALQADVVCDLRAADLARGGQGAPITPLADLLLFAHPAERRAVVNLGGFCNYTLLPVLAAERTEAEVTDAAEQVRAADVCSCNQLLDHAARAVLGRPFDAEGAAALGGRLHMRAFVRLRDALRAQAEAGRSLGAADRVAHVVDELVGSCPAPDLLRTACAAIADVLAQRLAGAQRVLVGGGGARNGALLEALRARMNAPVELCDVEGVPAAYREAVEMAVLGALCADGVAITLPQVTGVASPAPLAGVWACGAARR